MFLVQKINKHFGFIKDKTLAALQRIYKEKFIIEMNYADKIDQLISLVSNHIASNTYNIQQLPQHSQILSIYGRAFRQLKSDLSQKLAKIKLNNLNHEENIIRSLQKLIVGESKNIKSILQYSKKEIEIFDDKLYETRLKIESQEKVMEQQKLLCFTRMLKIVGQFDQDLIKQKYYGTQSLSITKFLGDRRSQMYYLLNDIEQSRSQILNIQNQLKKIMQNKAHFMNKLINKIQNADKILFESFQKLCCMINKNYQKNKYIPPNFQYVPQQSYSSLKRLKCHSFIKHFQNIIYILLNPRPAKVAILDHRESLQYYINAYQQNQVNLYSNQNNQKFQHDKTQYNQCIFFVLRLKKEIIINKNDQSHDSFQLQFKQTLRKKQIYRDAFILFIYELSNSENEIHSMLYLAKLMGIFLDQCEQFYDSQCAIKMILMAYQLNQPSQTWKPFYIQFAKHPIWHKTQFWNVSFIQSVYQYFDVIVIFRHKTLVEHTSLYEKSTKNSFNWLNAFNFFSKSTKQTQPKSIQNQKQSLHNFYREIIKNLSILYLSIMMLLEIQQQIVNNFTTQIIESIKMMNWDQGFITILSSYFQKIKDKSIESLQKLLNNKEVIKLLMSKVFGVKQQDKQSKPLSKALQMWISMP